MATKQKLKILYVRIPASRYIWMRGEVKRLKFRSNARYISALLGLAKENLESRAAKKAARARA